MKSINGKSILLLIIILAGILTFFTWNYVKDIPVNDNINIVGGDRDIHGCIGSAGYSWCEIKNKCLRPWEETCENPNYSTSTIQDGKKIESCAQKNGVWYPEEKVCEVNQLTENECKVAGGEFNNCASACRHDPKAEVCTMQCVLTCTFK